MATQFPWENDKPLYTPQAVKAQGEARHVDAQTAKDIADAAKAYQQIQDAKDKAADKAAAKEDLTQQTIHQRRQFYSLLSEATPLLQKIRQLAPSAAGFGAAAKNVNTSQAKELDDTISQLKAINFKAVMDNMKAGSKTGSTGLGRILAIEIPKFDNLHSVLDQARSAPGLISAADQMENNLRTVYTGLNGDADKLYSPDAKVRAETMADYGITEPGQTRVSFTKPPEVSSEPVAQSLLSSGASTKSLAINPNYQKEYDAYVAANRENLNPKDYAAKRLELDKKYGYGVADPSKYRDEGDTIRRAYGAGMNPSLSIPPINVAASEFEKARAGLESTPGVGPALGVLAGASGEVAKPFMSADSVAKLEALKAAHPATSTIGALTSDIGMNALGTRLGAPSTLINAYQGASSNYDPNDPLVSAGRGALTGAALGKFGELAGTALTGVSRAASAIPIPNLTREGVPLTIGELGGAWGKKAEDIMARVPLVGSALRARQQEGAQALEGAVARGDQGLQSDLENLSTKYDAQKGVQQAANTSELSTLASNYADTVAAQKAANAEVESKLIAQRRAEAQAMPSQIANEKSVLADTHEALKQAHSEDINQAALQKVHDNIGSTASGAIGHQGVDEAQLAVSNAYQRALNGVNVPVTPEFKNAVDKAVSSLKSDTEDGAKLLGDKLDPFITSDVLTGDDYQKLMRTMGAVRGSYFKSPEKSVDYFAVNNATRAIEDAANGMVTSVSPETKALLDSADAARRDLGVVENASAMSVGPDVGNPQSGVFDAKTLHAAATNKALKFGTEANLAGKAPEVPFIDFANGARESEIRLGKRLEAEKNAKDIELSLRPQVARDAQQDAMDAAKKAVADALGAHSEAYKQAVSNLEASYAAQSAETEAQRAAEASALQQGATSASDTLKAEYAGAKNAPRKMSDFGSTLTAFGAPVAVAGDVALESALHGKDEGDSSNAALRDIGVAGLALAPNLLYGKAAQRLLSKGLLGPQLSGQGGELLQKYLPSVLGGAAVGTYGAPAKQVPWPSDLSVSSPAAQLPLPSTGNIPVFAPEAAPTGATAASADDTQDHARGGRIKKSFSVK